MVDRPFSYLGALGASNAKGFASLRRFVSEIIFPSQKKLLSTFFVTFLIIVAIAFYTTICLWVQNTCVSKQRQ